MKSTKLNILYTFVLSMFFFACSSSPEGGGSNPDPDPDPVDPPTVTSVTLTSNKSTAEVGEEFTFLVKTNTNQDVTSQSTISVNGTAISGNKYTGTSEGSYTVKATYNALTSNQLSITVTPPPATATAIAISASSSSSKIGDTVSFTVDATMSDGTTQNQTNNSTFYINGTEISGNTYLNTASGDVVAYAKLGSLTSAETTVQVSDVASPATYTKKAVVEDYTGTWCGWCPRVSHAIDLLEAQTDKVFAIAAHIGDGMENTHSTNLKNAFGVTGYPTAWVNRVAEWTYPEPNNVDQAVNQAQGSTDYGLAVNSLLSGNNMSIVISTGFSQAASGTKLVVFILEDEIVASQTNYTSYYGGGSTLPNFVHNHVLRHSLTDVMGDATSTGVGVNHTSYNLTVPSTVANSSNTGILAMLVDSTGKNVLNAQYAKINIDKDFD